jgi:hypothetical protein
MLIGGIAAAILLGADFVEEVAGSDWLVVIPSS